MSEAKIVFDNTEKVKRAVEEATASALTAAALAVEGAAVLLCPVDTGNLRASINHQVTTDEARIGTNTEYAPYLEYGTENMKKQPYLRPALDNNKGQIKQLMSDQYRKRLQEVAK